MNILEKLLQTKSTSLLWQGNNGWLIWDGKALIATDLDLFSPQRVEPASADTALLAKKLSVLFITHGHEDHFASETVSFLIKESECLFVIPKSCEEKAKQLSIPKKRILWAEPGKKIKLSSVRAECTKALHGHISGSIYSGASMQDCGYILHFGGKIFYQPGDTLLLEEHFNLKDKGIDLLFVSPTEHNTKIKGSVLLISSVDPALVVTQHHSTYSEADERNLFWAHGYQEELKSSLPEKYSKNFVIPSQKNIIEL